MTGEMSKADVTREEYPLYFACAEAWNRGSTVEPFDVYQGPYINIPGVGRIFGCQDSDRGYFWYNDRTNRMSAEWLGDWDAENEEAIDAFCDLVESGGEPIPKRLR